MVLFFKPTVTKANLRFSISNRQYFGFLFQTDSRKIKPSVFYFKPTVTKANLRFFISNRQSQKPNLRFSISNRQYFGFLLLNLQFFISNQQSIKKSMSKKPSYFNVFIFEEICFDLHIGLPNNPKSCFSFQYFLHESISFLPFLHTQSDKILLFSSPHKNESVFFVFFFLQLGKLLDQQFSTFLLLSSLLSSFPLPLLSPLDFQSQKLISYFNIHANNLCKHNSKTQQLSLKLVVNLLLYKSIKHFCTVPLPK